MASNNNRVALSCEICSVYLSDVRNDRFVITQCGHVFHESHIRNYINLHPGNRCPVDRQLVDLTKLTPVFGYDPSDRVLKVKLAIVGDSGAGKTSLAKRFSTGERVRNSLPTPFYDLHTRNMEINGEQVSLQIWDPTGMDRFFAELPVQTLRGCHGIIFCYDPMHFSSLVNVAKYWTTAVTQRVGRNNCYKILIECKTDLRDCQCREKRPNCRPVTAAEKKAFLEFFEFDAFQTSVLESTDAEIAVPFERLIEKILNDESLMQEIIAKSEDKEVINLQDDGQNGNEKKGWMSWLTGWVSRC